MKKTVSVEGYITTDPVQWVRTTAIALMMRESVGKIKNNIMGAPVFENTYFTFFQFKKHDFLRFLYDVSKSRKKSLIFPSNRLIKLQIWLDYDANIII